MSLLKSVLGLGAKTAAPADAERGPEAPKPGAPTSKPTEEPALTVDDRPRPELPSQPALQARTVAEQAGRRGNFTEILSAQKAGLAPKESLASVSALTRGKAFAPKHAKAVEAVTGHPITKEGLEKLYGSLLPDANVFVTGVGQDRRSGALEFTVNWMDNDGALVAKLNRRLARHEDGDLELYSHGCWVEPSHRSRAISAAVMQKEIELLESISDHPRTRLSLWAGGMRDPNNPEDFQPLGVYVWATMGFDCAQNHGRRSELSRSGGRARCDLEAKSKELGKKPDFELMKLMFDVWVDNAAERGQIPDDPDVVADLKRAADLCPNMWSLATLQVPGLEVEVELGGTRTAAHVGKAFLLSEEAPRWEGVFYVNTKPETFRAVADGYCGPRVDKAQARFEALQAELAEALDGEDRGAKRDALAKVGRSGDQRWVPALEAVIEQSPELADDARAALDRVTGRRLTEALAEQAEDPTRPVKARLTSLDLCIERAPERREALLTRLIEGPRTSSDFEVARAALNRLARGRIDPPKLLDLLTGLYDRALNAREVKDPADVGGRGRGKSFFSQKVDTREAVVGHLSKLKHEGAEGALLRILAEDPYWEVGASALDAFVERVGAEDPARALATVEGYLDRARGRHDALKREQAQAPDQDAARKVGNLMHRISRVRTRALESLAKLEGPAVADALERALNAEPYWDAVGVALEGLAKVVGQEQPSRVVRQAERWYGEAARYAPMRERAVDVLAELGTPEAQRALVRMTREEPERRVLERLADGLADAEVDGAVDARARIEGRIERIEAEARARRAQLRAKREG